MKYLCIGDIHQNYKPYLEIINECDKVGLKTIQLGDLGFDYSPLNHINHENHKFIMGNHDNYGNIPGNCLGDYGIYDDIFYIRGGFSIDAKYRTMGYDLFWNEELGRQDREDCLALYKKLKPKYVISHEAPRSIIHNFTNSDFLRNFGFNPKTFTTNTSELLERCFKEHQPKEWLFAHFHRSWDAEINGTKFRLLNCYEPYILTTD